MAEQKPEHWVMKYETVEVDRAPYSVRVWFSDNSTKDIKIDVEPEAWWKIAKNSPSDGLKPIRYESINEREKWERWGSLTELEKYLQDGLLQLAVDLLLQKTKNDDIRKKKGKPMDKVKMMARQLIFLNGDGVLNMLKASDPTIKGWQCIPTKYPAEK